MRSVDMTVGSPTKKILLFSIPVLLGLLFQQCYNLTDTVIVGRFLGEQALASVGSTASVVFLILGVAGGFTQGMGVLISNAFGAKDETQLRHLVAISFLLTLVSAMVLTVPAVLLCRRLLVWMDAPADILEGSASYLRVIFTGIFFTMSYNMAGSVLRAVGDSKTPLYFLVVSSCLNILLDILFITRFRLGVAGVAAATVIAQGTSALLCYVYMFRQFEFLRVRRQDFRPDLKTVLQLFRIGIPMALNHSVTAIGHMVLQRGVNSFGPTVVASFTAASKVETLITQFMGALGTAMSTYCGQNLGAGRLDRIYTGVRRAMVMAVGIAALGLVLYFTSARLFLRGFIKDPSPELMRYAMEYLTTSGWFLLAVTLIFVFRSSLLGLRMATIPMLGGAVELVTRWLCIHFLLDRLGFWCIRLTNPIDWAATALFLGIAYFVWEYRSKRSTAQGNTVRS